VFPGILKIADEGLFFCFVETLVKAADVSVTFECCPHGLVGLTGHPHWLVGRHWIGATASPKYKQNDKDTIGCLQEHRRDTATVRTKAPRVIFGSLIETLSDLTLDLHRAP